MEIEDIELDHIAQLEGSLVVELACGWIFVLHLFHELSCPYAGVLVSHLSHHDGVVGTEERNDEFTIVVICSLTEESGLESQNILIVGKEFLDVFFGRFRVKTKHVSQTVLFGAVAVVRRNGMFHGGLRFSLELKGLLLDVHVLAVPITRKSIAVIDETVA